MDHQQTPGAQPNFAGHRALRKGRVSLPNQLYLITTATDHRQRFFADFAVARAAARCFEDRPLLGDAQMLAWVLMPDHCHLLLQLGSHDSLSIVVNRLKSASSRAANRLLARSGSIWQRSFHDRALRADEDVLAAARYLVANPLRAGLCQRLGEYPFWNAMWL